MLPPELSRIANDMVRMGDARDFSEACRILASRRRGSHRRRKPTPRRRNITPPQPPPGGYWWQKY